MVFKKLWFIGRGYKMGFQFSPGETLRNSASTGIDALGTITKAVLKTVIKITYAAYLTGTNVVVQAKEIMDDVIAEAKQESGAKNLTVEEEASQPNKEKEESSHSKKGKEEFSPKETKGEAARHTGIEPGTPAPVSGIYQEIRPKGGKGVKVESEKGEPLPHTRKKHSTYTLIEESTHNE